jgi:hypothetical protein
MRTTIFVRLALAGLLVAGVTASAFAQSFDKRTYFTFSGPVTVPGVTLPAGKYMFRVANTTQRDVLQVLSADGVKSYALFFALRTERPDRAVSDKPELRFMETPEGMTPAVDSWFYPSDRVGYEFIYPKAQARALARGIGRPVLTAEPEPVLVTPAGEEAPFEVAAAAPAAEPDVLGEPAPQEIAVAEPPAELPKTASTVPVFWVVGLGLMLGASTLRGVLR